MGFLNNMADEFGKKTGKAIGNKLYGSNADDIRIGGSIGSSGGANSEAKAIVAELKAKQKYEREQKKELEEQTILEIEFDTNDIESIKKSLFTLSAKIEAWISKEDSDLYNAGLAKYKNGLEILQFTDPSNPSVLLFQNKLEELKKKKQNAILKPIIILGSVFIASIILLVILINVL